MKTIEEKAIAYDEAIKRASNLHKDAVEMENNMTTKTCEIIFPELAESEDERIRKALIRFHKSTIDVDGIKGDDILDWLEKQDEQKSIWHNEDKEPKRGSLILLIMQSGTPIVAKIIEPNHTFNHGERWAYIDDLLGKKGEQKPTDRVEPKFKTGDWIIQQNIGLYKVIEICESWYEVVDNTGKHYSIGFDKEHMCRPWTIQDAKDGDVLVCESGKRTLKCLFIFKLIADREVHEYCSYRIIDKHFSLKDSFLGYVDNVYHPATKEQRDTLMKAMANAGYTFDFEKKELKKL